MGDLLFTFDEEYIPRVVVLATAILIGIFAVGLVYRLLALAVL
ncbi:hypothetical protein [Halovivax gelatinilyticus]|nr:hypothetical protein [Halovivax gelatinilyticus]